MCESASLVIVAIGMKRVYAETRPHLAVKFVLDGIHTVKFHEHGYWTSGDFPAAHSDAYTQGEGLASDHTSGPIKIVVSLLIF